ncbi:MAG: FGGY-family carbohydrate kinase [Deltaproteobacteria bacterium]|nr:FGGY-family carbohydrate kinase [Deltaproteobacteria bacterium]
MLISESNVLAIDLGTSGPKVSIISMTGTLLASQYRSVSTRYLNDGGVEQSPAHWWEAVSSGVKALLREYPQLVPSIRTVCCSAQWSGTVAVDEGGEPLADALIWMDSRGAPFIRNLIGGGVQVEGYHVGKLWKWTRKASGAPGKSGKDSLAHIIFLREKRPELYKRTFKFLEPKDYLNLKLTGKFASTFDAIALHWVCDNRNIDAVCYDEELLNMAGLERDKLPDLCRSVDILGPIVPSLAREWGLSPLTQVIAGSPDLHIGAVGSGAVEDYVPHICVGTSSWLTCHVPYKKTDVFNNLTTLPSALPGRYLVANEQSSAGVCLQYLWENFAGIFQDLSDPSPSFERLDQLASRAPSGSKKMIFTPWLSGERTPVENHFVRGGFHNLSLHHSSSEVVRAVLEGVAYNSRWLLKTVESFVKRRLDPIYMIGGGANSDVWCQIIADVLERRILQVSNPRYANARGAAWLGALALGKLQVTDIPKLVVIKKEYAPNSVHRNTYKEAFREFLSIYKSNQKIYRRLNS